MLQFESNLLWIFLIIPISVGLVWVHYQWPHPWSKTANLVLRGVRFLGIFFIALILLSPFLKTDNLFTQKTSFILAVDDSESMISGLDPIDLESLENDFRNYSSKIEASNRIAATEYLSGFEENESLKNSFSYSQTDIDGFLHELEKAYDPNKISGVLLVSDGIFNSGLSPDFDQYPFPVHVLGTGDTTKPSDLKISFLDYNRIAYTGSKYPMKIEYSSKGFASEEFQLIVRDENSKLLHSQRLKIESENDYGETVFYLLADSAGRKKITVSLYSEKEEFNKQNNSRTIYVDVIDDKKKVLIAGLSPHPDMGAIRNALGEKEGIELSIWFKGSDLNLQEEWDLIIFHQIPNFQGVGKELYEKAIREKIPKFFIWGKAMDLRQLGIDFKQPVRGKYQPQVDDVMAFFDEDWSSFNIPDELKPRINQFPPQVVPFGDYYTSSNAQKVLNQKIGSVNTDRPLLFFHPDEDHRIGVFMGTSLWKWRLAENQLFGSSELSDLIINGTIQYLVLQEEKDRFKFYAPEKTVYEGQAVKFKSEYYNEIFERTFGNQISLRVKEKTGEEYNYQFTNSGADSKFQITGLDEGDYWFEAKTNYGGKEFIEHGNFSIIKSELEQLDLAANHKMLKSLASRNGGSFFNDPNDPKLDSLLSENTPEVITVRESKAPAIDLEWILFILSFWLIVEWFFRKRLGGY